MTSLLDSEYSLLIPRVLTSKVTLYEAIILQ